MNVQSLRKLSTTKAVANVDSPRHNAQHQSIITQDAG